jgi:hypothetical protein
MRLTIIANDKCVGVNNLFFDPVELPQLDPTIHAVQWYGEYGEVEYKTFFENGIFVKPVNIIITDVTSFQFAIDAWEEVKTAREEAIAQAAAEAASNQPTTTGSQTL